MSRPPETQATTSAPAALSSSWRFTKDGRCFSLLKGSQLQRAGGSRARRGIDANTQLECARVYAWLVFLLIAVAPGADNKIP